MSGFRWPPNSGTDLGFEEDHRRSANGAASSGPRSVGVEWVPGSWLEHVESALLGVREAPFDRLATASGWSEDPPELYCPSCLADVGPGDVEQGRCHACEGVPMAWERGVRLGSFEGVLREGIVSAKYRASRRNASQLGRRLGRAIRGSLGEPGHAWVVPIPTSFRHRLSRGIDHAALIARGVACELSVPCRPILRRSHRPSQVSLPASKRWANVRRSMRCEALSANAVDRLIVIDDVRTTGSTLREACRAIRSAFSGDGESPSLWVGVLGVASG